jgi:hypothetical protein
MKIGVSATNFFARNNAMNKTHTQRKPKHTRSADGRAADASKKTGRVVRGNDAAHDQGHHG